MVRNMKWKSQLSFFLIPMTKLNVNMIFYVFLNHLDFFRNDKDNKT